MTEEEMLLRLYQKHLAETLGSFGFQFSSISKIERGWLIELGREEDKLHIIYESGLFVVDLILRGAGGGYWQVVCNTALWYCGIKDLKKATNLEDAFAVTEKHLPHCCGKLLAGDLAALDDRYCFQFQDLNVFMSFRRGRSD